MPVGKTGEKLKGFNQIDWDSMTFSNNLVFLEVMKNKELCKQLMPLKKQQSQYSIDYHFQKGNSILPLSHFNPIGSTSCLGNIACFGKDLLIEKEGM